MDSRKTSLPPALVARIRLWRELLNERMREAAANGHVDEMITLLEEGADINSQSALRTSALHLASYGAHLEVVKALLARGASVNRPGGHSYYTPLGYWIKKIHEEIVANDPDGYRPAESLIELGVCLVDAGGVFGEKHNKRVATKLTYINNDPLLSGLIQRVQNEARSRQIQRALDVSVVAIPTVGGRARL